MQSFSAPSGAIKEPLGGSSLEDWPSFLESSPGETTPLLSRVSRLELIALFLRTAPGLAVLSILWVLFLLGLVFGFIQLISWEMPAKVSSANSTAASLSAENLDGWMARKLYCNRQQPCDILSLFSEDGPSNLKYEIQPEEEVMYVA